ncbi:hypothetical protein SCACP_29070 [Sporomusa carbonis]
MAIIGCEVFAIVQAGVFEGSSSGFAHHLSGMGQVISAHT